MKMTTIKLTTDLHERVKEVAARERRSVAETARLLLGSGLVRYEDLGTLLDRRATRNGELVLFPLQLRSPQG
jgi:hypothetical protein